MNVNAGGFYGRKALLDRLDAELADVRSSRRGRMLIVRGRRQVGKSRLLTHFVETRGVQYLYTTAVKNASTTAQLGRLTQEAHSATAPLPELSALFSSPPLSWEELFRRLRLSLAQSPGAIVVLDEFPWAAQADQTLESILQHSWDRELENVPVLLALVGSDVAMMERLTEHNRPLFGRAGIVVVKPFNPSECAQLLDQRASASTVFDAHLITGGYPRLLGRLARFASPEEFVRTQLGDETSDLAVQAQLSIDAEFPPDSQARRVLSAIGSSELGPKSFSRIVQDLAEEGATAQTAVTRALKILINLTAVVSVDLPVGAANNTRLRRYRITDPYLRFWFRFVEPQLANISRGRNDLAVDALRAGWRSWRGKAIEPIVRDAVMRLAPDREQLRDIQTVGGWWNRDNSTEIDLVAARRDGAAAAIGSIKWRENTPFNAADYTDLQQIRHVASRGDRALLLVVCPAGITDDVNVDLALTADDLLAAWS